MRNLIIVGLFIFSFSSFAGKLNFSSLDCSVEHPYPTSAEKLFKLKIKFKSVISAVNDSGLDKTQVADMFINHSLGGGKTGTISLKDISFRQSTSAYGYELAFRKKILGSKYESFASLQPNFQGLFSKSVISYRGNIEINAYVNGKDEMIIKTEDLSCIPNLE